MHLAENPMGLSDNIARAFTIPVMLYAISRSPWLYGLRPELRLSRRSPVPKRDVSRSAVRMLPAEASHGLG